MFNKLLLEKLKRGACTPEELAQLQAYFKAGELADLENELQDDWNQADQNTEVPTGAEQRIWQRLTHSIEQPIVPLAPRLRPLWSTWRSIAAAVLLLIASAGAFWLIKDWGDSSQLIVKTNTTESPLKIALEDGSVVWLNERSTLKYRQPFAKSKRDLHLQGEAYFEVAKDARRPFTVEAGGFNTTALGTSFNIRAMADSSDLKVALLTGKVSVRGLGSNKAPVGKAYLLNPGQQLRYHLADQAPVVEEFDTQLILDWREGKWVFENEPLIEVFTFLEKRYRINIQYDEGNVQNCIVNSSFDKAETITNILSVLAFSNNLKLSPQSKKKFIITGMGCD
jgi:ferric-dicitrate binding protein FerR (iron transport regulator)